VIKASARILAIRLKRFPQVWRIDAILELRFWLTARQSIDDFWRLRPRRERDPAMRPPRWREASWAKLKGTSFHTMIAGGPTM
jgi:hypothetical protein